jgi:hypothetical protein
MYEYCIRLLHNIEIMLHKRNADAEYTCLI